MKPRLDFSDCDPQQMWQASWLMILNSFAAGVIVILGIQSKAPPLMPLILTFLGVTLFAFLLFFSYRKTQPLKIAELIYLIQLLVSVWTVWEFQEYWLELGQKFQGFMGYKLLAIIFAIQAPSSRRLGLLSVGLIFTLPLVQYYSWSPMEQALIGPQEPWMTSMAAVCSGLIYHRRLISMKMAQNQAKLEALSMMSRRFAHLLLGLQHLSNTPLQVLEGSIQLLRDGPSDKEAVLAKMEKSFVPLRQISGLLSFEKLNLAWQDVRLPPTVEEFEKEILALAKEIKRHQNL